jgi:hypothetical protein
MTRIVLMVCAAVLLSNLALGKRIAPAEVEPVIHEGIRYVAPNDDGRRGYIEAWDVQTNKKLSELTVFTNRIDPKLEEDVQWVFIKSLGLRDGMLVVTSERGKTYQIDLKTKAITQLDRVSSPSPEADAQLHDIPEPVRTAIKSGSLAEKYEVSFRVNPFYLRGDFNGDGKIGVAVLVKQRATRKLGIVIIDGLTNNANVLGAGTTFGNGGDDFAWMDTWEVYSKSRVNRDAGEGNVPRLHGDGLLVGKNEAASALIYWNGQRYVWVQQGD